MRTKRIAVRESFSILYRILYAAVLTLLPLAAHAVDMSWHRSTRMVDSEGPRTRQEGNVIFANGERAVTIVNGTDGPMNSENWITFKGQEVMRFDDRSMIIMQYEGRANEGTRAAAFQGEFLSGTGRFEGIAGTFKCAGKLREVDCSGSYSLPAK
jgi:hypothetical protein